MFHLMLILFPLILTAIIIPIILFGLFSIVISIFGGTAAALLIKNKKVRSLCFIGFIILSMIGAIILFPFISMYTNIPFDYYPLFCNILLVSMGILSTIGISLSRSFQNKMVRALTTAVFITVIIIVVFLFIIQII
ncbi:hypothetical protein P7E02_08185 [Enterococcus hulanensis]|uniref:hypothetical protein n=1 Tax=Enterococcus hulanensis TaxID=2559929 RepID=UPI00288CD75E|nr:hypothetical protein [Enterococcus hulanensis]MDT2659843.1 hypothetical protein [Enterococcus hulanensis]